MITPKDINILKHSLGLTNARRAYRNYFVADINGSDDQESLDRLVDHKFMKIGKTDEYYNYYYVTDEGRRMLNWRTGLNTNIID